MFSYKELFFRSFIFNLLSISLILILAILASTVFPYLKITRQNCIFLLPFAILRIISDIFRYRPKTIVKSINSKIDFTENLKEILAKLNWRIVKEKNGTFEIKPNLLSALLCKKIIINISDNQVELIGASDFIQDIIWEVENK
ncbi:hypothetical protein [Clostridium sp. BSD9I1]|uniref:hypothetical protein n=1 Tax=Clostridium sp. BSD9I1 TaxID=2003589 RepID=UPI001648FE73|nr:hypothetical protein [Clostridium sp. BSD9I1]